MLPESRKSAEPLKVGCTGTSDPVDDPASEPAMARETEPMADAPADVGTRQLGGRRVGMRRKPHAGGALVLAINTGTEGMQSLTANQPQYKLAVYRGQIPHGV